MDDHLSEIEEQTLHLQSFILVGLSWGSILALYFANKHPDKIEGLVLGGAGRQVIQPNSLKRILELPFSLFVIVVLIFIIAFPIFFLLDQDGYRQKYGALGILQRLGLKQTQRVFNSTIKTTYYSGKLNHDTVFINLTSDYLVNQDEIHDLIRSNSGLNTIIPRFIDPPDHSHIHLTHELDSLIIDEIVKFIEIKKLKRSDTKYVK